VLNPTFITFHLEAHDHPIRVIEYIKNHNIKVGISIKPNTDINLLKPYLHLIDLVLIMSVEPGFGGQTFIKETTSRIQDLLKLRDRHHFLIEVDGGINEDTIDACKDADIVVVGSYITSAIDYELQIQKLKKQ
jgi:ribulose-phosphate 3-epimerase